MNVHAFLTKIVANHNLTRTESQELLELVINGKVISSQLGSLLTALHIKGETPEEILGFISVLLKYMLPVKMQGTVIDTCGTGGDGSGTFNISTAVALVVAGSGVKVAKHGNRAASSQSGSADVLEALGVNINLTQRQAEELLEKIGITFLFAPLFHPALKAVGQIRRKLRIPTIFNYLGPFANPARVKRQLIGVPTIEMAQKLARVATHLNYEYALIVTSEDGLDEISLAGKTHYFEIKGRQITEGEIDSTYLGFAQVSKKALKGGDAKRNGAIIRNVLQGKKGPQRDAVVMNAGAAFYIAGKVKDISDGVTLAQKTIDSGKSYSLLQIFISESRRYI